MLSVAFVNQRRGSCTDANCGGGVDGGYCEGVVRNFTRLGGTFGTGEATATIAGGSDDPTASASQCVAAATGSGAWKIAPGAFSAAVPIAPLLSTFLALVGRYTSKPPILTTGSAGHSPRTTNGTVSEHSVGRAGDFGSSANGFPISSIGPSSPSSYGDELATAALVAAGLSPADARSNERRGGITNVTADIAGQRIRVQVIWRSNNTLLGGNHTNHVHIGVKPMGPATGQRAQVQHSGP